jgi:hypothetical protein
MRVGIRVECVACGRTKKPIGRAGALECAGSNCDDDCRGYRTEPFPGSLWPGETEEEFGYPISHDATVEVADALEEE